MVRLFQHSIAVVLLAWLPFQAVALPALAFLCEPPPAVAHPESALDAEAADSAGCGLHHDEPAGAGHCHGQGCCHHLYSAALTASLETPRAFGTHFGSTPLINFPSFFPEQPQRPPLS